jgi:hypothetical protein
VEEVLKSQMAWGKLQYLIKWRGFPNEENTWEPEANLKNSLDAIHKFHTRFPNAPQWITVKLNFVLYENHTIFRKSRDFKGDFDNGSNEDANHFCRRKS